MDAFADIADVEARWRPLSDQREQIVAQTLCDDASDMIRNLYPATDDRIEAGSLAEGSVRRVVATMVKRAMIAGDNLGVQSQSQAAGPFSVNQTFANPTANLYLTADEKHLFSGPRSKRAFTVDLGRRARQSPPFYPDWRC